MRRARYGSLDDKKKKLAKLSKREHVLRVPIRERCDSSITPAAKRSYAMCAKKIPLPKSLHAFSKPEQDYVIEVLSHTSSDFFLLAKKFPELEEALCLLTTIQEMSNKKVFRFTGSCYSSIQDEPFIHIVVEVPRGSVEEASNCLDELIMSRF